MYGFLFFFSHGRGISRGGVNNRRGVYMRQTRIFQNSLHAQNKLSND